MDAADFEFVRIPEFDVKELKLLFETDLQQCGKKRAAEEDTGKGVGAAKRAKTAGPAVKIGREEAAKYWQSLIDAGRELGVRAKEKKTEVKYTSSNHMCSLTLKRKAAKTLADNEAFLAAMCAKTSLSSKSISASTTEELKFGCIHCDKTFTTRTSLGQHIAAKHEKQ